MLMIGCGGPTEPYGEDSTNALAQHTTQRIAQAELAAQKELAAEQRRMLERQAEQQSRLLAESERLAEASGSLVAADAAARQELAEFQSQLEQSIQSERQSVDRQREQLDQERQEIALRRHRDPLIAAALVQTMTWLVAMLPVLALLLLFRTARDEPSEAAVAELLVRELTAEQPLLLPAPVQLRRRLSAPGPDAASDEPDPHPPSG